jgi:vancomycin resistance protein YoaR
MWRDLIIFKNLLYIFLPSIFILVLFVFFNIFFISKVYPNVYFANQSFSGVNNAEVLGIIQKKDSFDVNSKISFKLGEKSFDATTYDLGFTLDNDATSRKIVNICRDESYLKNLKCKISSLLNKHEIIPTFNFDFYKLNNYFESAFLNIDKKAINAKIEYDKVQFTIIPSRPGEVVDRNLAVKDILENLEYFKNEPIYLHLTEDVPTVEADQLKVAVDEIKNIEKRNITFAFGYDKWSLNGSDLVSLFNIDNFDNANNLNLGFLKQNILIFDVKLNTFQKTALNINIDEKNIENYISNIAKSVNRPTKDAGIRFENGKIIAFTSAIDGQLLDKDEFKKIILKSVVTDVAANEPEKVINLPVKVTRAKITNNEINSLGINERIGSGISYFAGSIPNRVSNIGLGSKLISGAIVAPGDVFSFNNLVGPVSAEQGFKQAYVINKGRTVLDDGGGICQVSTTVFRAALNAGLPIIKRTAHAYRVGYYEQQGFKPGLDATIFSPSVDFQFKNDTAKHILVQAVVDLSHSKLQVDIFGTGDGRRVELGNVIVSNVIPAPEPLYQDDLSLPKGTVQQIEHAANGATSIFSRKVYKANELIINEDFKSVFKPWQAVYLVGKG